jgi:hypothetical protein
MRVFISYSHDATEHEQRVRAVADQLRTDGVDAWIDQYVQDPDEGWVKWMRTQVREAEKVLLVFTETYQRRFEGDEEEGKGLGATFEGVIVTQWLYESGGRNAKFRPVVFRDKDAQFIPVELRKFNRYRVDTPENYENLLRWLYQAPRITPPPLGQKANLPPDSALKLFGSTSDEPPVSAPASLPGSRQGLARPQPQHGALLGQSIIHGSEWVVRRTRTLQEIGCTSDDHLGLQQLVTSMAMNMAMVNDLQFDVCEHPATGVSVVIPTGAVLTDAGGVFWTSSPAGRFTILLRLEDVSSGYDWGVAFERYVANYAGPGQWNIDPAWTYQQWNRRFDGALVMRKGAAGYPFAGGAKYVFQLLARRGNTAIAIAAINHALAAPMLWEDKRQWAQAILCVHLSQFSPRF